MGPGPTFPVGTEIPVIWTILTVRAVQIGAPPWRSMRPVDEVAKEKIETLLLASDSEMPVFIPRYSTVHTHTGTGVCGIGSIICRFLE